jgi:methylenetetrahydrofolate reductase (NADPH)
MKIIDILNRKKLSVSFEIFPPKKDSSYDSVMNTALDLSKLHPDFMSVTYGAGGTTCSYTTEIASELQRKGNTPALAHLTCVGSCKSDLDGIVENLQKNGIQNVLALRGDFPQDESAQNISCECKHASDLARFLKEKGSFCIGGACYPEGHPESKNRDEDLENLRFKVEAGCDFLTTQMFFDNDMLYSFLYRMQSKGIHVPVLAGIMPVTNAAQIKKMISLSNAYMPRKLLTIIDRFADNPEALKQAGIAYATDQIIDLITNGVRGIHLYSMNKTDITSAIMANLTSIISAVNGETDGAE